MTTQPPSHEEVRQLRPIDHDKDYDRYYIPLPGGWEVQTKGRGSSFRIANTKDDNERLNIPPSPYLFELLERMAREIHAAHESLLADNVRLSGEVERLRRDVGSLKDREAQLRARIGGLETELANVIQVGKETALAGLGQSERIAALEKDAARWNGVLDLNQDDETTFFVVTEIDDNGRIVEFLTNQGLQKMVDAALSPAGQCSGTATGREG